MYQPPSDADGAGEMQPTDDHVREVKRQLSQRFLGQPGISGVGIERDEDGQPLIVIHVSSSDPSITQQIPDEFDGVRIRTIHSGPFQPLH
jgi:hypothetical protein